MKSPKTNYKILIAIDSFKDCMSSLLISKKIESNIHNKFRSQKHYFKQIQIEIKTIQISDGGEGFQDAILNSEISKYEVIKLKANDPIMRQIDTNYIWDKKNKTAIIESAKIIGLELLAQDERSAMITSSFGLGELIANAISLGAENIIIGIGGTSTNDAGTGLLYALGAKILDENNFEIFPNGCNLGLACKIDITNMVDLSKINFKIATDVTNLICGEQGATFTFAKQKGASEKELDFLESNIKNIAEIFTKFSGRDILNIPGLGAGGGLPAALYTYASNTCIESGFDLISKLSNIESEIESSDAIITGEGHIDNQSQFGKVPFKILELTHKHNKPCIAFCGQASDVKDNSNLHNFDCIFEAQKSNMTIQESIKNIDIAIAEFAETIITKFTNQFSQ